MSLRRPAWDTLKEGVEMLFDFLNSHRQLAGLIYDVVKYNPQLLKSYVKELEGNNKGRMLEHHKMMLENEIKAGRVNDISIEQIFYDIITMNMSVFMSLAVMENVFNMPVDDYDSFLAVQKDEIIKKLHYRLYGKLI